jgi:hypothetical protein
MSKALRFDEARADLLRFNLEQHGFVRVVGVIPSSTVERLRRAVDDLATNAPAESDLVWRSPGSDGGLVVQRISRANTLSVEIAHVLLAMPELRELASWLLDVPVARVGLADGSEGSDGIVLVIKDPANASVHRDLRWHRDDTFTQHLAINPFLNCGVYLDRADVSRGGLLIVPGSHLDGGHFPGDETIEAVVGEVCVEADPGDVVVHRSDVWHRSGPHEVGGERRRVLYANAFVK